MSILNHFFDYKPEVLALDEKAMELCQPYFRQMEEIRDFNQLKMLKAFADTQMSSTDMLGTTGYGLWDTGRAKLEQIFAQVMGAEDALVRSQFQSGTHTLAVALFGLLRAGDTLLAATGRPYDTLEGVIGLDGKGKGIGGLLIVEMANSLAAEGLHPVFLCAPERVRFYSRLGFAKQAEYARYVPEK